MTYNVTMRVVSLIIALLLIVGGLSYAVIKGDDREVALTETIVVEVPVRDFDREHMLELDVLRARLYSESLESRVGFLISQIEAGERQLALFADLERCLTLMVLVDSEVFEGTVLVGETELCGANLHVKDGFLGPSLREIIENRDTEIARLERELDRLRGN